MLDKKILNDTIYIFPVFLAQTTIIFSGTSDLLENVFDKNGLMKKGEDL